MVIGMVLASWLFNADPLEHRDFAALLRTAATLSCTSKQHFAEVGSCLATLIDEHVDEMDVHVGGCNDRKSKLFILKTCSTPFSPFRVFFDHNYDKPATMMTNLSVRSVQMKRRKRS